MSEHAVATSFWRCRTHTLPGSSPVASSPKVSLEECIRAAQAAGECPSGWPVYAPEDYLAQLEVKAELVRQCFPEARTVEVMPSPPSHHRMRAKVKGFPWGVSSCFCSFEVACVS
jgi:hypothetical protein